jgi:hypothetical protein
MARRPADTQGPARAGRLLVRAELERRGARVREAREGMVTYLELLDDKDRPRARVRVKTRRSGTWQARASDGAADPVPPPIPTFWAFVDLGALPPRIFVADDAAVRRDIQDGHQRYLERHGGRRAVNQASDHHAIQLWRVERWRDGWKQLGLRNDAAGEEPDRSMTRSTLPSETAAHLVRRVNQVPAGARVRSWTLRDDNHQHHHGVVSASESPLWLRLRWRRTASSSLHEIGLFRLDLRALLAEDYVRPEQADGDDDRLRLRFVRAGDSRIYIQWRRDTPALAIGEVPGTALG